MDAIDKAIEAAQRELLDNPQSDVHAVYRGIKTVNGNLQYDADGKPIECVVCVVGSKANAETVASLLQVPRAYSVGGVEVLTDIIEAPPARIARLDAYTPTIQATSDLQKCFNCPIPGGAQIAPRGAQWVGTLGCALSFDGGNGANGKPWGKLYGALTNYHVAVGGQFKAGAYMQQPDGLNRPNWFARLHTWKQISFGSRAKNLIDVALLNCRRTGGDYGQKTDTVSTEQFGIGKVNPEPYLTPKLGDAVIKVGRTTGVTRGTLVGTDYVSVIDYGPEGAARFERQYVFRADRGNFSNSGDSGSLILHEPTLRPMALLFAGGGRDTIANPIGFVLDWCKGQFFKA
jgi:hypothetical protein